MLRKVAATCGVDASELFRDKSLYRDEVQTLVSLNKQEITGVPHFIIGHQEVQGA